MPSKNPNSTASGTNPFSGHPMPNTSNFLTIRATPTDLAAVATIAAGIRDRTGAAFVSRAEAIRFALSAAVDGPGAPQAAPEPGQTAEATTQ